MTPAKRRRTEPVKAPEGEPRWLDETEQQAWRGLLQVHLLLFGQLERELTQDAGMPMAYYEVLVRLSEAPDRRLRMSDLAEFSNQSRSRLSHAVSRLGDLGWVERSACDEDRRGAWAVLTDAGMAALIAAAPCHVRGVRAHVFDQLTGEQVVQLQAISEAIAAPLRPGQCSESLPDSSVVP
jgi:DNA-binding MarR family transcriptional regulator